MALKFGAHLSIAGGYSKAVGRALENECETFQIFSGSPRTLILNKDIDIAEARKFVDLVKANFLGPVVVHTNYLINIASPDDHMYEASMKSLRDELVRADELNASFLILHPGHAKGLGRDEAIKRIAAALNEVCNAIKSKVTICLENMSGTGTEVGGKFSELHDIIKHSKCEEYLGICLDTCHAYVSGYDISNEKGLELMFEEIEDTIGSDRIKVVHVNDSVASLGSKRDRHANIGKGAIGSDGFRYIVNRKELKKCPFIVETPEDEAGAHLGDVRLLRSLVEE